MRIIVVLACLVGVALALSGPVRGSLSPEFVETQQRERKVCCLQGTPAQRSACAAERTKAPNMTYWSMCVGATGYGCDGVSKEIKLGPITIPITVVKQHPYNKAAVSPHGVSPNPDKTMVGLFASVGAIMHDRCCTKFNDGAFCNSNNTPFISTINVDLVFKEPYDNNCACLFEWRRAVFDLFHSFGEVMNFPKAPRPDLLAAGVTRSTSLPGKLSVLPVPLRGGDWNAFSNQDIQETKGTNLIKFSKGIKLPCIPKADSRCRKSNTAVVAGDSSFCKSGKFSSITVYSDNHGVGVCA